MRQKKKLRMGFASFLALCLTAAVALLSFGGTASAEPAVVAQGNFPDPQTTNVPYLAWAGEQIRLEKCFSSTDMNSTNVGSYTFNGNTVGENVNGTFLDARAEFLVEDWSGNADFQPQIEQPTVKMFWSYSLHKLCVEGDAIALHSGLARIEVDVTDDAGILGLFDFPFGNEAANPVAKHQFLAGWMTLNKPTLKELASTDFAPSAQSAAANALGDPAGDGHFTAGGNPGILSVKVTGSIPLQNGWDALFAGQPLADITGQSLTLPNDWPSMAKVLATDASPKDATPANRWDIHDDSSAYALHTPGSGCLVTTNVTIDAVDNCAPGGGNQDGPFSSIFGLSNNGTTIGPFDPLFPNDTLLADGKLDASDAPMPAARVDFSIAQNSGGATDISGVGSLAAQDKNVSYSRDFTGNPTPSNLYAPFYDAYIPATARDYEGASSGIDGPSNGNNFPGFINADPLYHFWDTTSLASNSAATTNCLQRSPSDPYDEYGENPQNPDPDDFYTTPSGDSTVAVYTDEEGEAQVQWNPGLGFYFNSLINSGAAILNANGGCDLQSIFNVQGGLGNAAITATARYPYKPVSLPSMTSNTVNKDAKSLWSKTLGYFPKGAGTQNNVARIVVAHAQNIDGTAFKHEKVCLWPTRIRKASSGSTAL